MTHSELDQLAQRLRTGDFSDAEVADMTRSLAHDIEAWHFDEAWTPASRCPEIAGSEWDDPYAPFNVVATRKDASLVAVLCLGSDAVDDPHWAEEAIDPLLQALDRGDFAECWALTPTNEMTRVNKVAFEGDVDGAAVVPHSLLDAVEAESARRRACA